MLAPCRVQPHRQVCACARGRGCCGFRLLALSFVDQAAQAYCRISLETEQGIFTFCRITWRRMVPLAATSPCLIGMVSPIEASAWASANTTTQQSVPLSHGTIPGPFACFRAWLPQTSMVGFRLWSSVKVDLHCVPWCSNEPMLLITPCMTASGCQPL